MNPNYEKALFKAETPPDGWPAEFAVITGYNPPNASHAAGENRRRDTELQHLLGARGYNHWRVNGGSPDFGHVEPGFAIEMTLGDAIELGKIFGQEAIFWIQRDALVLVECNGDERKVLGSWAERLARGNAVRTP